MRIFVNGLSATIMRGAEFEYVRENPDFTEAEGYSTAIELPLDCSDNKEIFGRAWRLDSSLNGEVFDGAIEDKDIRLIGIFVVTGIDDHSVKLQFLDGESKENYLGSNLDEILISDLDLGKPSSFISQGLEADLSSSSFVALPWYNASGSSDVLENNVGYIGGAWHRASNTEISFQPYMVFIAKQICSAIGYTHDFTKWEASNWRFLLSCNTLPASYGLRGWARALPPWSVTKFFEELGLLMDAQFSINKIEKHISMEFRSQNAAKRHTVVLQSVDKIAYDVDKDAEVGIVEECTIEYEDGGHQQSKYYDCPWLIDQAPISRLGIGVSRHSSISSMKESLNGLANVSTHNDLDRLNDIHYCLREDKYFIFKVRTVNPSGENCSLSMQLQEINSFGPRNYEPENGRKRKKVSLSMVPVCLDDTDYGEGKAMFLSPGAISEYDAIDKKIYWANVPLSYAEFEDWQTRSNSVLNAGDNSSLPTYYDKFFVAFWFGNPVLGAAKKPCAIIDRFELFDDWSSKENVEIQKDILRLNKRKPASEWNNIDSSKKYNINFLSKGIPDARSFFIIDGQRFICEKITADVSADGISELKKGVFYKCIGFD